MKYENLSKVALVAAISAGVIACNPLKKMAKHQSEVNYKATPNPLELKGDSIQVTINGSFPAKYFNKKVSGDVTPTLKYGSNSQTFKTFTIKGEDVEGEGTKISYEKGGSFSYTAQIPYKDGMDQAELDLVLVGKYKSKTKSFDPIKVDVGTIITPKLVQNEDQPIIGKDKFQKTTPMSSMATINYVVATTHRIPSSLNKADVKAMKSTVDKWAHDTIHYAIKSTSVNGYASPEGEIDKNKNLASDRAKDGAKYAQSVLKHNKVKGAENDNFYSTAGQGEDWDGFKKLMDNSDIKNKDLILRVAEMYKNPAQRQQEVENLAKTYSVVENKILPKLRRAEITVNADSLSRTDAQIQALSKSHPDSLTPEELLYSATLTNDLSEKERIYKTFEKLHSGDWRGPNNVGYIDIKKNDLAGAKSEFEAAAKIAPDNKIVNNNLGVVARLNGNNAQALDYYKKAEGAGPEVKENEGLVYILLGHYDDAVDAFSGVNSFNAALAQLLHGDYDTAMKTIEASKDKDTAIGYYLKAVIGARKQDKDMVVSNLKNATAKDASLKAKAKKDLEFRKYKDDAQFQSAVN